MCAPPPSPRLSLLDPPLLSSVIWGLAGGSSAYCLVSRFSPRKCNPLCEESVHTWKTSAFLWITEADNCCNIKTEVSDWGFYVLSLSETIFTVRTVRSTCQSSPSKLHALVHALVFWCRTDWGCVKGGWCWTDVDVLVNWSLIFPVTLTVSNIPGSQV